MATYYWVGGTGNWDAATTTNWATSSGGAGGAGVPTSADDVIFDAGSNIGTGTFTVTITGTSVSPAVCRDFSTGGAGGALDGVMTLSLGATSYLDVYGSLTLPATNFTWSGTSGARTTFKATSTGKTVTTNGVTIGNTRFYFDGAGGEWTLGSAITLGVNNVEALSIVTGTFITNNYNITLVTFASTGTNTRTITLGSSTISCSSTATAINFSGSGLTLNANTSQFTCSSGSAIINGNGQTFYNVSFTATTNGSIPTVNDANTFNNLSFTTPASGIRFATFSANQTINGTLTLGAANTAVRRITCRSSVVGTRRTLTAAAVATLADVDFQDINAAGVSAPWSGTRLGNCGNNVNITTATAGDKYWYSATGAGGNWSAAQWETTAGGTTPSVNNFPLPQDTVKFQNTGLNSGNTLTIDAGWNLPAIDGSGRTLAMTLASGTTTPTIFGDLNIPAVLTITGTGAWRFSKQGTQNVTTNSVAVPWPVNVENGTGSVKAIDNWTISNTLTLTTGGLDCNSKVITSTSFSSSNTSTRSIAFGTGKIAITANNAVVLSMATMTGFSYTGTPLIDLTYSGATGTRTIALGGAAGATEANAISVSISAGSDAISVNNTTLVTKNLNTTGFSGTLSGALKTIYGDLTLSATTIWGTSSNAQTFAATSGTQTVTTNGVTINSPVRVSCPGATVLMNDAITLGPYSFTQTAGTLKLKASTTNTASTWVFSGTVSTPIVLESTLGGTRATISQASGTVAANYLTVKDSATTGGATFNAFTGTGSATSANNINNGNNLGWNFIPSGASFISFF